MRDEGVVSDWGHRSFRHWKLRELAKNTNHLVESLPETECLSPNGMKNKTNNVFGPPKKQMLKKTEDFWFSSKPVAGGVQAFWLSKLLGNQTYCEGFRRGGGEKKYWG